MIKTSAPGKLVLVGEYAVLDGAPAMAVAVDRRVQGQWQPREDGRIVLNLPPVAGSPISLPTGAEVDWRQSEPGLGELGSALSHLRQLIEHTHPTWLDEAQTLSIDSSALHTNAGVKLGLGSSAAVAAAVAGLAAWSARGHLPSRQSLHEQLWSQPPHASGSGLDLATVLNGGLIEYRRHVERSHSAHWNTLQWPESLKGLIIWSGQSASSPNLVAAYRAWKRDHPKAWSGHFDALNQLAEKAISAFKINNLDDFIEGLNDYGRQMGTMGDSMGAGIVTPMHRHLMLSAARHGVMYKPSGAGGGDIGIVLSTDPDRLRAMGDACKGQGLLVLALTPDSKGLELEAPGAEQRTQCD